MCLHPLYTDKDQIQKAVESCSFHTLDKKIEDLALLDLEGVDLEFVFTAIFTVVDDMYPDVVPSVVINRPGPQPHLSDSEVISISLVGEMLMCSETSWVRFVSKNYRYLFPQLNERSRFHRRSKDLWIIKSLLRQRIVTQLGGFHEPLVLIDSVPVPICHYIRSARCKLFAGQADIMKDDLFGVCESKEEKIFGFKLHLLVTLEGIPITFVLAPARPHDVTLVKDVLDGFYYLIVGGDKGYVGQELADELLEKQGIRLVSKRRKNQKVQNSPEEKYFLGKCRKMIETVNSILTEQFHLAKHRTRTLWGLISRIISKMTSLTLAIFLNRLFGEPLLQVKHIV
jgi:IS5 family transposase